ncbi:uncharacterized protein LOC124438108 [Xenia sp. Carnegie-2017]|uniref:uncharacterized protein LOC124438108 n=1 Tax=Xenia sp. Carnegie-2017 TaxID=2897299 RepID=UPI001F03D2F7|nr:uncharacterized protein LOC124438108 [Xenia sp. Carnegie-2017]
MTSTSLIFGVFCVFTIFLSGLETKNIHVSNTAYTDAKGCGEEDQPCPSIIEAVKIAKENDVIKILATKKPYKECPIVLTKPLKLTGHHNAPLIDCNGLDFLKVKITKSLTKLNNVKIANMKITNSNIAFSFSVPTYKVYLFLENVNLHKNNIDVYWRNSQLCYLTMDKVKIIGESGNAIEMAGCNQTVLKLTATKFYGKYINVRSTDQSWILRLTLKNALFDMSSRLIHKTQKTDDTVETSPLHIVTALKKNIVNIFQSHFLNHFGRKNSMINITSCQKWFKKREKRAKYPASININVFNTNFTNNTVENGTGAAMWFNLSNWLTTKPHILLIRDSTFIKNKAVSGGAVWFSDWKNKSVQFDKCEFVENEASVSGGALHASGGRFNIKVSRFENNAASKAGGTIFFGNVGEKPSTINFDNSTFKNRPSSWNPIEGGIIYIDKAESTFKRKVKFDIASNNMGKPIFFYDGNPSVLKMNSISEFHCPKGYSYEETLYTYKIEMKKPYKGEDLQTYHRFSFVCKPCQDMFYTMSRGRYITKGTKKDAKCHPCPDGASCNGTIRAKANFWGRVVGEKVEMLPCPKGYCCDREPCLSYDVCREYRTGTLCSHCSQGYTETMSSTKCHRNEICNGAWWFWPLANLGIIFFLLCFYQEVITFLTKWLLWSDSSVIGSDACEYRPNERNLDETKSETENDSRSSREAIEVVLPRQPYGGIQESDDYNNTGGFLKVFYYFYQVVFLIRLNSVVETSSITNNILDFLMPLINFQFSNFWACAGRNLTPVRKVVLKNSVAFWLFIFILLSYCVYRFVKGCRGIQIDDLPNFKSRSFPVRLVGMTVHVSLLSYIAQTQLIGQLLDCVNIGNEKVLYISGSIKCYTPWQVLLWIYFFAITILYPVALLLGSILLRQKRITHREFICACFVPLLVMLIWAYKSYLHWRKVMNWEQLPNENDPYRDKINYILQYPYKSRQFVHATIVEHLRENWETVLISRRLILVLFFIFTKSYFMQAFWFIIASTLFLWMHVFVQPYKNNTVNKLDMIALSIIVILSSLSLVEVMYHNASLVIQSEIEMIKKLESWFLACLPFVLIVLVFAPRFKYCFLKWGISKRKKKNIEKANNTIIVSGQVANEGSPLSP